MDHQRFHDTAARQDAVRKNFAFRRIRPDDADQVIRIEQICFPPNEACTAQRMRERIAAAGDYFLVAEERRTGRIAGFLNGLASDEDSLRDEFFTDVSVHHPDGKNVMLLGLSVLPEYRGQGLARALVAEYRMRAAEAGKRMLILTCLPDKVTMYRKFGFTDRGISGSAWGGEKWHEMVCRL